MYSKFHRLTLGVCLAALLLLPTASFGADPVKVTNYGSALVFEPQVEAHDMILTVTGPCNYELRRSLRDDRELVFQLDKTTIDGRYRFQVTVIPNIDSSVLDVLQQARKAGDNSEVDALCREGKLPADPEVQVAGFGVVNGEIVYDPESIEKVAALEKAEAPAAPQVHPVAGALLGSQHMTLDPEALEKQTISGDLTVYNSLCVGFDCLANESYGADTIRLKENNLRIHVDDTSTAGSYPRTDWRLEFNSNANGGGSYFRVNDVSANRSIMTLEAGAPSHSLYVDSGGRVGNGTSNPVTELHSANGDTPTLRLEQTTASGFAAQTWDIAGNETSFFVRDASNGSTLPFRIRPGASSNSLVIDSDNDVGIGILSPAADIHINRTSSPANFRVSGDSAGFDLQDLNGVVDRKVAQQFVDAGLWRLRGLNDTLTAETVTGIALDLSNGRVGIGNASSLSHPLTVGTNGTNGNGAHVTAGGVWTNGSSREFKEGIQQISAQEAIEALLGLDPVRYRYTIEPDEEYVGFIAEEVPDLVATQSRKYLSPMDIVAVLTKVVQEQQRTIEGLSVEIDRLANKAAE